VKLKAPKILPYFILPVFFVALLFVQGFKVKSLSAKVSENFAKVKALTDELAVKESSISALVTTVNSIQETTLYKELNEIKTTITSIKKVKDKIVLYKGLGVKTDDVASKVSEATDLLIELKLNEASLSAAKLDTELERLYEEKKEADRRAVEEARKRYENVISSEGYVRYNVQTDVGVFNADTLVVDLNKVQVVTDTANDSDCKSDCPLLSLASFVSRNGGFAGINGTYYCPPEYSDCGEKKNSFDFPVYNTRLGKWINKKNLSWDNRALITFSGNSARFYKYEKDYGGGSVSAGITMVPGLLQDGSVIVGSYKLEPKETIKSTRSSIGFNGSRVYAIVGRGANNYDMAYIHKAVGSKYALALDGGGSINFMYNGTYYAGPGRAQANSIIFRYR